MKEDFEYTKEVISIRNLKMMDSGMTKGQTLHRKLMIEQHESH